MGSEMCIRDSFNAALLGEAGNVAMATGFNWVGDTIKFPDGGPQKIVAHAIMGGLLAELTGSDFKTGAVAAGLNEALIPGMAKVAGENKDLQLMLSQLTGLLAAAAVDGDLNTGSTIAEKATAFNYLFHAELLEREQKLNTCASPADCQAVREYYNNLDTTRNKEFGQYCRNNPAACLQVTKQLADEIPANEKLLHDGRGAGFDRSIALWEITRGNERAINTGITEKTRTDKGDGAAFLTELAADALNPDRDLFASTAGGKGGTTGVKVGVVGEKAKGTAPENMSPPGAGRSGAFNEAKRQSGIPSSQQPSRVLPNVDKRGNRQPGTIYEFEVPSPGGGSKTVRIRDDAGGHDFGVGNPQNRGSHFNDEDGNHYDY